MIDARPSHDGLTQDVCQFGRPPHDVEVVHHGQRGREHPQHVLQRTRGVCTRRDGRTGGRVPQIGERPRGEKREGASGQGLVYRLQAFERA